eukprot:12749469-Prorocentrum_lima.AAC.1
MDKKQHAGSSSSLALTQAAKKCENSMICGRGCWHLRLLHIFYKSTCRASSWLASQRGAPGGSWC